MSECRAGEMALEEFLKEVSEKWRSYQLELVNYQNKCRLIRGWDDLFNRVKEHMSSLQAMKLSVYYKVIYFWTVNVLKNSKVILYE